MVKTFITDTHKQKPPAPLEEDEDLDDEEEDAEAIDKPSYFDLERHASEVSEEGRKGVSERRKDGDAGKGRLVDVSIWVGDERGLLGANEVCCRWF